ncbi:hypothetical protein [Sphingomonas sp.]|uniref:hypothetical protein n=1 Tax=Sphingomonas sp. TaxID=28214 RepID=UPI0025FAEA63|nr:hypothetical protein [Sphingomonas sp.]MBV9528905.1 hypothetical protein [Sphingomonas sp.]
MLHLLPLDAAESANRPYDEAVSRLSAVRHAIRLVEPFGHGPASDPSDDEVADAWDAAGEARRRWFGRRSEQMVNAAAAGIEALLAERQADREPNTEAGQALTDQIRRELAEVARVVLV